jgi:hypothetical protein
MVIDRERQAQQSRGYVLGLILLIMFLSSQDFSPPTRRRLEAAREAREGVNKHREDIKEKVRVCWGGGEEVTRRTHTVVSLVPSISSEANAPPWGTRV